MKRDICLIVICFFCLFIHNTLGQEAEESADLLFPDSLLVTGPGLVDTLTFQVEVDSVAYSADSIYFNVSAEVIQLSSNARIVYLSSSIKAEEIQIDLARDRASTYGETWMQEGSQVLYGEGVVYDIESGKGIIREGASRFEKGFYYGEEIRKVEEEVYDIDDGYFTTCESAEPHFYIYSGRMRLYYRDKVVGKPVVFYVNHFPIMFLPFATFSVKTERASGILVPEPGYNSSDGKYIENIALYYAYDDYLEALTALDWREKTGWEARFESNYIRRYMYHGNLLLRFQNRTVSSYLTQQEWYARMRHRQDFLDQSSLDANLEFMSSRTVWQSSDNIDERLNERVTSSIAYRKPMFNTTLSSGANYTENLTNNTKQIVLPTVSFSLPSKPVYELFTAKDPFSDEWWRNFNFSYSFRGAHTGSINDPDASIADILYKNTKDEDGNYVNQHNAGIRHSVNLSYNQVLAGWLNFSQNLNGNEVWFDRDREESQFVRGNDYSTSTRLSASMYGIGNYPNFRVRAVRHVLTPAVSFNYSPDHRHNQKFYSFGGIGLNSGQRRRMVTFGLDNRWSIKLFNKQTEKESSLNDVLSLGTSVSYDLERDERPFSDISHNASIRPGMFNFGIFTMNYNTSGSAVQDAYDFNIINWRVSNTFTFNGNGRYYDYFPKEKNVFFRGPAAPVHPEQVPEDIIIDDLTDISRSPGGLLQNYPWSASLSHDYSRVKATGFYTSNLRSSFAFRLTRNWSLSYSNYINVQQKELVSQSVSVDRDLGCWKLLFSWSKQGNYWNYRLQLHNIQLPDALKLRRSDHRRG